MPRERKPKKINLLKAYPGRWGPGKIHFQHKPEGPDKNIFGAMTIPLCRRHSLMSIHAEVVKGMPEEVTCGACLRVTPENY